MQNIKLSLQEELSKIKNFMYLYEDTINHIYQPTGNSCGPTCIKMVGDFIKGDVGTIDNICKTCGTDWVVGTPPDMMKKGLEQLGISYIEHIHEIEPYQSLRNVIDKGNVAIVRTITQNIPHWIVVHDYNDDTFKVNDPWLGQITYNEEELESIWKIRDFFFYEIITGNQKIISNVKIRKMEESDIEKILPNLSTIFDKTGLSNKSIWNEIKHYNSSISIVATVDDEIAGFYFLCFAKIPKGGDPKIYKELKTLNGVEGIALGVNKKFKNMGVGKKLIDYTQNLDVDYIWGYQFKSLKNIDDWLKRRKIYLETETLYLTYQKFV
jgi:hypothetical protein